MLSDETTEPAQVRDEAGVGRPTPELMISATPKARRQSAERLANVERLRIFAMLEIVTFHVGSSIDAKEYRLPILGGLGLPVFLLLNNAFNTTLSERVGTRAFLDVKVARLVLPWLIWCGIYGGVVLGEKLRHDEPLSEAFSLWMLIGGTYEHLWFVPFALFGSLIIAGVQARTRSVPHWLVAGVMLAVGAAIVLIDGWILEAEALEWPKPQWLLALPSPLLGFALGRLLLARDRPLLQKLAGLLTLIAVATVALTLTGAVTETARRYAISTALVTLLCLWPGKADPLSHRLTPLLFGVYLTHPLLVRLYQGVHLPELPTALLGVLVFGVAALIVEALRRSPLRRLV